MCADKSFIIITVTFHENRRIDDFDFIGDFKAQKLMCKRTF